MGSSGATNRRKFIKDVRSSFMKEASTVARALSIGNGGGALPGHRPRLAQTIVTGLCDRNNVAPLGLTIHSQMKVVPSTSLGVHDPSVRFRKGQIKVHSFRPGFLAGNHSARTRSIVTGESTRLLVQGSKGSKRSMMDHEPHGWVVIAAPDDLSGHQDTSFA